MSEFLEYTLDKFTFPVATDRYYNPDGVWAKEENSQITIGLSDFLQQRSGDIAFADIVESGTELGFDDEVANIETIKVDFRLPSPVSGTVIETNPAMEMEPEVINEDPYGAGWLAVIEASNWPADQTQLLDPQAYYEHMKIEAEEEAKNL
ncbi:MAG: glycine cleavage system protein H [Candidatus Promineifilaceae bacterium]